jgi:hypothetical protein
MFNAMNEDEIPSEDLSPLQEAEIRFLDACGVTSGSPYLFSFQVKER